jgi:23S rRNA pseudouridine1911/1915/1917 synthase
MPLQRIMVQEKLFEIIHHNDDLLVINKPADLVCHPTKGDVYSSLISRVRLFLGTTEAHLVNRLDRETSGITLVAKNLPVAVELRGLWENRIVQKEYLAIVHGHVAAAKGCIDAPLGRDEHSRVRSRIGCARTDSRPKPSSRSCAASRVAMEISRSCESRP